MLRVRVAALCPFFLIAAAMAHGGGYPGGQYRGPGDVVPPGSGGGGHRGPGGPTTGGPSGPSGPAAPANSRPVYPTGPTTGGPTGPSAPAPGAPVLPAASTGGGAPLQEDYDTWDRWWEFNKSEFLRVRDPAFAPVETGSDDFYLGATRRADVVDTVRPSREQALQLLPVLKKALDSTEQRDITTACMVAMAKIGADHPEFTLLDVFAPRLKRGDQEVRETAALAIGIAAIADDRSLTLLEALALDSQSGRAARDGSVDERTRAFAAYGLGLTAQRSRAAEVKRRAFGVLAKLLERGASGGREVRIAAIHGISVLAPAARSYDGAKLRDAAVEVLMNYFAQDLGGGDEWVQAHCPTAIAKLLQRDRCGARSKDAIATVLRRARESRRASVISQSCVLALGEMAAPHGDTGSSDASISELLLDLSRSHPDLQTRNFALLALGRIGGAVNRSALLREFDTATKAQRRPWCALALGVLVHRERLQGAAVYASVGGVDLVGSTLADAFREAKDPGLAGAIAVALGLSRCSEAARSMRERLLGETAKEQMAGYLCIGLALLDERNAVDDIRKVALAAGRRPVLLVQAAVSLGKLGDKAVAADFIRWLTDGEPNLSTMAAVATALGQIGDRRSLVPLRRMLFDTKLGGLPRAFAAAAIGGVADRHELPWNACIGNGTNYRAAVPTLTDQAMGILDIL